MAHEMVAPEMNNVPTKFPLGSFTNTLGFAKWENREIKPTEAISIAHHILGSPSFANLVEAT